MKEEKQCLGCAIKPHADDVADAREAIAKAMTAFGVKHTKELEAVVMTVWKFGWDAGAHGAAAVVQEMIEPVEDEGIIPTRPEQIHPALALLPTTQRFGGH